MATTRRVFLEILGAGACASSMHFGCTAVISGGPPGIGDVDASSVPIGVPPPAGGGEDASVDTGAKGPTQVDAVAEDTRRIDARDAADANIDRARDTGPPMLQPGDFAAGNISALAVGALNALPGGRPVAIARDAMGVYALTLVCTHNGCTAEPGGNVGARQINCPCHGSQFDRNGAVTRGPAGRPLVHFSVTVDAAGNIIIHSNTTVATNVRVMA